MRWLFILAGTACLALEPGYVDSKACRTCHQEIYDAWSRTGMARSFARMTELPGSGEYFHKSSDRYYSVVKRGPVSVMRRWQAGNSNILEQTIDYAIGSGNHSRTFVHDAGRGQLIEMPLSWYAENGGSWAMSPGYDRPDHSDFRRRVSDSCLFCHNAYPSNANNGLGSGIDCQRCHGPGEAHVRSRGAIVNPAKLDTARQMDVCLQCHMESASRTLPDSVRAFGRDVFSFRPGEPLSGFMRYYRFADAHSEERITVNNAGFGLMRSQCFLKSGGRLTCTTCHNPHGPERNYTAVCRSCHAASHEASVSECTSCHMQKRRTEDAVHVVMTDHLIRRRPLRNTLAAIEERHDRLTGRVEPLYPAEPPRTAQETLYLALAQMPVSANPKSDAALLESALSGGAVREARAWVALGNGWKSAGDMARAAAAFRKALELSPAESGARVSLAGLLAARGELQGATALLEPAAVATEPDIVNALAVIYGQQGRWKEGLQKLSLTLASVPDNPVSWLNMGVCLEAIGDQKGAEAAYRQALLLQPDLDRAQENLARLLRRLAR